MSELYAYINFGQVINAEKVSLILKKNKEKNKTKKKNRNFIHVQGVNELKTVSYVLNELFEQEGCTHSRCYQ